MNEGNQRARSPINGRLRDELLNEEMFDTLADAQRRLDLWRHDYNHVGPHSSLGGLSPAARRTLTHCESFAPGVLAKPATRAFQAADLS